MSHKFPGDPLSDDESNLDITELPIEYRVKNGFLRSACSDGHETLTRILLDKGADVNYITSNTQLATALHVAISSIRETIVPILLPHASAATVQAALQYAIHYQTKLSAIIKILQHQGGDSPDTDSDMNTPEKQPTKSHPPQKENETQTSNLSQKENQTQTNGSDGELNKSQQQQQQQQQQQSLSLEQQLKEQQKQLQEQQQKLQVQQQRQEEAQKKVEQAQQLAVQAQKNAEETKEKIEKQNELLENQEKQIQILSDKLNAQESQTAKLNEQIETQDEERKKLAGQISNQEVQIKHMKERIEELERENKELSGNLESFTTKSAADIAEFQAQISALQKDVEAKEKKIEIVSHERDSERRAKEVAKKILTSAPRGMPETLGHSHAIRMGTIQAPSPTPPSDDDSSLSLSVSAGSLKSSNSFLKTRLNGVVVPIVSKGEEGERGERGSKGDLLSVLKKAKTTTDMNLVANVSAKGSLSSKSRSQDDMDIATEADRARVRRLVARWEEIKLLEIPATQ